jgi:uncharacterized Zn finger protein
MTAKNTGRLLSIYCPVCRKVTDKISFNLLREAGKVTAHCPQCHTPTHITYNGKSATLYHHDADFERIIGDMTTEERKDFKAFVEGKKK